MSRTLHWTELAAASDLSSQLLSPALRAALPDAQPALLAALYGSGAPRHVYLLVDGTLRAEVAGLFDLDGIDVPARCLFDGEAAETMAEVGPWLVDLSIADPAAPGDPFVLRDLLARHWPAGFSILVSTDAPFDAVRSHLRRFTKLPVTDDGQVLTFRFWDPRVLAPFLQAIEGDPSRLRRMTMTDDGLAIAYLLPPSSDDRHAGTCALRVVPNPGLAHEPVRPMRLSYADFDPLARARAAERRARMADRLRADFLAELGMRSDEDLQAAVDAAVQHYQRFGFRRHAHLHLFAAWSAFYGPGFERGDDTGALDAILRSDAPEDERFAAFRARFETFTVKAA